MAGVSVRGAAPGTRETDVLKPGNLVEVAHAVVLSGGSAFGLSAADGVMRFLAQSGIGVDMDIARVPIVPAAVLFDLGVGDPNASPDAAMGRAAATAAAKGIQQGPFGAGCGCTIGKLVQNALPHRGGIGSASMTLPEGVSAVNYLVVGILTRRPASALPVRICLTAQKFIRKGCCMAVPRCPCRCAFPRRAPTPPSA